MKPVMTAATGGVLALVMAFGLGWGAPARSGEFNIDTVLLTGDSAPDGGTFASFDLYQEFPQISAGHDIVFKARTEANSGIWRWRDGIIEPVVLVGDRAPGAASGADDQFDWVLRPVAGANGDVLFKGGGYTNPPDFFDGIWRKPDRGEVEPVALRNEAAPGVDGGTFQDFNSWWVDNAGTATVFAWIDDCYGHCWGIWRKDPGAALTLFAFKGTAAPGTGRSFAWVGHFRANDRGDLAFRGGTADGRTGVWVVPKDGSMELVARTGDIAPGRDAAFTWFEEVAVGPDGTVALLGSDSRGSGIWKKPPGERLVAIAVSGDDVPGLGLQFTEFRTPSVNGAGRVAVAAVAGPGATTLDDEVLVREGPDGLVLVARESDLGPHDIDPTAGYLFSGIGGTGHGTGGSIAGVTTLIQDIPIHGGAVQETERLVFLSNGSGARLSLGPGDRLEVKPGDSRVISKIFARTGGPGLSPGPGGVTDDGRLAFRVTFEDGSQGLFVAYPLNAPPEARDQVVATDGDTARKIALAAHDPNADALTYEIVSGPTHGTLGVVDGDTVTYRPAAAYHGEDSFFFKASDGIVDSNTARVSITVAPVNDPPAPAASADRVAACVDARGTTVRLDGSGPRDAHGVAFQIVWSGDGSAGGDSANETSPSVTLRQAPGLSCAGNPVPGADARPPSS